MFPDSKDTNRSISKACVHKQTQILNYVQGLVLNRLRNNTQIKMMLITIRIPHICSLCLHLSVRQYLLAKFNSGPPCFHLPYPEDRHVRRPLSFSTTQRPGSFPCTPLEPVNGQHLHRQLAVWPAICLTALPTQKVHTQGWTAAAQSLIPQDCRGSELLWPSWLGYNEC